MAGGTTAERGARERPRSGGPGQDAPAPPRRTAVRRVLVVLLALAVLVAATLWALYGSSWLRLTRVRATGTGVLTAAQVEKAARAPIGSPLISVDTHAIETRIERSLPRVDSVAVTRSWPHTVQLEVTERQPVLVMRKGAEFEEVDADGVRFDTVDNAPAGVVLLELTPAKGALSQRFTTARLLRDAAAVRAALPAQVARWTRAVQVRSYDDVSLSLTGGRTVMWGSGEDGAAKARALTALLKAVPDAGHFDVSAPTAPAASGS